MESVRNWSALRGFDYRFYGDEIFELVPDWYQQKACAYKQISTDYGRLILARNILDEGNERVIWLDADVLVFDPQGFVVDINKGAAFGREIWIQPDSRGRPKAYRNVHNAFCCFCEDSTFLDFYAEACLRIMERSSGRIPPQIVGPKLLTALHNIIGFQLLDQVGMISPLVHKDLVEGTSEALTRLRQSTRGPLAAANLSASLVGPASGRSPLDDAMMNATCQRLLDTQGSVINEKCDPI